MPGISNYLLYVYPLQNCINFHRINGQVVLVVVPLDIIRCQQVHYAHAVATKLHIARVESGLGLRVAVYVQAMHRVMR